MIGEHGEAAFLKTLTLLYVEDDPSTRDEVAEFLRRRAGTTIRILLPLTLGWNGPGGPWGISPARPVP